MWYGTTLMRYTDDEFVPDPAFQCPGWPVTAQEMAPYYDEAERHLEVQVFPPEPETQALVDHFTKNNSGWSSAPQPLGLAADILKKEEFFAKQFNGRPMPPGIKRDAESAFLTPMRRMRNVRVVTDEWVVALEPDPENPRRVAALRCQSGAVFHADHVILAAGALNSPRLMNDYVERCGLQEQMPGAHLIGRYYKSHLGARVIALSPWVQKDILRKTIFLKHPDFPHSIVQTWAHVNPEVIRYASAVKLISRLPALVPSWMMNQATQRMIGFLIMTEEGSHYDNRVTGAADGSPDLDYDLDRTREALEEHARISAALRRRLLSAGYFLLARKPARFSTSHACGTMIAGTDPKSSVVGASGEVHGMENLSVADGSVLPRIGKENPALTIFAWGLRTGRLLADKTARRQPAAAVA